MTVVMDFGTWWIEHLQFPALATTGGVPYVQTMALTKRGIYVAGGVCLNSTTLDAEVYGARLNNGGASLTPGLELFQVQCVAVPINTQTISFNAWLMMKKINILSR